MKKLVKFCMALLFVILLCGCSQSQSAKDVLKTLSGQMLDGGYTDFTNYLETKKDLENAKGIPVTGYTYTINNACEFNLWIRKDGSLDLICVNFEKSIDADNKKEMEYLVDCIINLLDPDSYNAIFKELGDYNTLEVDEKRMYFADKRSYMYYTSNNRIGFLVS